MKSALSASRATRACAAGRHQRLLAVAVRRGAHASCARAQARSEGVEDVDRRLRVGRRRRPSAAGVFRRPAIAACGRAVLHSRATRTLNITARSARSPRLLPVARTVALGHVQSQGDSRLRSCRRRSASPRPWREPGVGPARAPRVPRGRAARRSLGAPNLSAAGCPSNHALDTPPRRPDCIRRAGVDDHAAHHLRGVGEEVPTAFDGEAVAADDPEVRLVERPTSCRAASSARGGAVARRRDARNSS